ncbi:Hypothetical protein Minf_1350 [Methylacidiphilum infernorum V4]|uniref:Uncharacterized protein n=1 Tax=Methylacidiphilum infernorum (isolate V4) TaxID=481448 RepID=B3DVQ1_METI4|nr:Hypothetical protein Minf_1350 [Methylacidiphilum infernorum V4]
MAALFSLLDPLFVLEWELEQIGSFLGKGLEILLQLCFFDPLVRIHNLFSPIA